MKTYELGGNVEVETAVSTVIAKKRVKGCCPCPWKSVETEPAANPKKDGEGQKEEQLARITKTDKKEDAKKDVEEKTKERTGKTDKTEEETQQMTIERPQDWEEIVQKLVKVKDPLWRVFLAASAHEQGETLHDAVSSVNYTVNGFRGHYGVRASLLCELAYTFGLCALEFYKLHEITGSVLKAKDSDFDEGFLREVRKNLDSVKGGAAQRKVRFKFMEKPILRKGPQCKSRFPFLGGSIGQEGEHFLQQTKRPSLTVIPTKLLTTNISPRLQRILEDKLGLPRGESNHSIDGNSYDTSFYREIVGDRSRLMRALEERGSVETVALFEAGPPFNLQ